MFILVSASIVAGLIASVATTTVAVFQVREMIRKHRFSKGEPKALE